MNESIIRSLAKSKVFKEHHSKVNNIDFHKSGEFCISSGKDEALVLYSVLDGKVAKRLPMKKYGCGIVRFTNHKSTVIQASQNRSQDETIRLLSLHDFRYLTYFRGHRAPITAIAVSPADDTFISASEDQTVRLWDVREPNCRGVLRCPDTNPTVVYDPSGKCFGVMYNDPLENKHIFKLYDPFKLSDGPFLTFTNENFGATTAKCVISDDGAFYAISMIKTKVPYIAIYDAFDGQIKQTMYGHTHESSSTLGLAFTPDSKYVISGSENGSIFVWKLITDSQFIRDFSQQVDRALVAEFPGHPLPVTSIKFNPAYLMMASACQNVVFWTPRNSDTMDD